MELVGRRQHTVFVAGTSKQLGDFLRRSSAGDFLLARQTPSTRAFAIFRHFINGELAHCKLSVALSTVNFVRSIVNLCLNVVSSGGTGIFKEHADSCLFGTASVVQFGRP